MLLRGDLSEAQLLSYVTRVKQAVPSGIPVSTADTHSMLLAHLTGGADGRAIGQGVRRAGGRGRALELAMLTNGAQVKHPDREAVARVIKHGGTGATLYFNTRTRVTGVWDEPELQQNFGYHARYGNAGAVWSCPYNGD